MVKTLIHRVCLAFLAISGYFVGLWAYFAPLHWFNNFPGLGMHWLPVLGPYNEHFAKDVGAAYLALASLSVCAFVYVTNRALLLATAVTWTIFNVLHLTYHLTMLHMYGPRDATANVIALSIPVLCSVLLAVPARSTTRS